jgi:phage baseplate assembly protein W
MFNFKLVAGDIMLDGQNNLALVEGDDEFIQSIQEILSTNAGEWFLNDEQGLRRYEILGQKYNHDEAIDLISEAIFQHDDVDRIEKLELDFNRKERKLSVKFEIIKKTGETVEGGVEI